MAITEKKYLSLVGLQNYDAKIKALIDEKDAAVLAAAKKHAEDLGVNYDPAGTAATKMQELADGQVKTNTEAIAKLNGDATTDGSVAKAVADSAAALQENIDDVDEKADKNAEDIAAINNETTGILAQAKAHTNDEVAKVQGEVDDLEQYVGTLPADATATDVVGYVQEKTAGIASESALTELTGRVDQAETDIDNIEKDYLKAADKTELEGEIEAVQTAVNDEKSRAEGIEAGLRSDVDAIKGDYLKASDKAELQGNIDTVSGALELLTNGVDAAKVDGVNDLIKYVEDHGAEVTGMQKDISDNADAIDAVSGRVATIEGNIGEGTVDSRIEAAKTAAAEDATAKANKALADANTYTDGKVGGNTSLITALTGRVETAEGDIDNLEASLAEGGATALAIADAKKAGTDAQGMVTALTEGEVAALREDVDALKSVNYVEITTAEIDAMFAA